MLRYVKLDLLQRNVVEFCCSRAVFSRVNVKVPDIKLLFDHNFILNNLKKYKRVGGEDIWVLPGVCGKCDGHGYFDWVTRLTTDENVDEDELWQSKKPIIVQNQNPIQNVFVEWWNDSNRLKIFYITHYDEDPLTYRCEQCNGIGLALEEKLKPFTVDEFLNNFKYKPTIKTEIKKQTSGILDFLGSLIFRGGPKNDKTIQNSTNH